MRRVAPLLVGMLGGCSLIAPLEGYTFDLVDAGIDAAVDTSRDSGRARDAAPDRVEVPIPCPEETHRCTAAPSEPWSGPFAQTTEACDGAFPILEHTLFADLHVEASSCECICGSPSASCHTSYSITVHENTTCSRALGGESAPPGNCHWPAAPSYGVTLATPTASCAGGTVVANIGATSWGEATTLCAPSGAAGTCATGFVCAPTPSGFFDATLCVVAPGERSCPPDYPRRG